MDKMTKRHVRVVFWGLSVIVTYVFTAWLIDYLFGILIPSQILLIAISGCMAVDAYSRIRFWKNRDEFLTTEELNSVKMSIFLLPIPAEVLFALLCIGSAFGE